MRDSQSPALGASARCGGLVFKEHFGYWNPILTCGQIMVWESGLRHLADQSDRLVEVLIPPDGIDGRGEHDQRFRRIRDSLRSRWHHVGKIARRDIAFIVVQV